MLFCTHDFLVAVVVYTKCSELKIPMWRRSCKVPFLTKEILAIDGCFGRKRQFLLQGGPDRASMIKDNGTHTFE